MFSQVRKKSSYSDQSINFESHSKKFRILSSQPGLRDSNDLRVWRKMATFQWFFQSGRAKELSAPLHLTHRWWRKSRPYKYYYIYNYICIFGNCRNAITQHTTTHTHTHQGAGSAQQKGEDNDKKIRMYKDAAFDFSRYNVVILAYSQGIFSKST